MSRRSSRSRRNDHAIQQAVGQFVEPLETRTLMSTINWANKGTPAVDTDGFNANFGANSTIARNIVQRAIDDWERVIVNFNYFGGGNTYTLDVNAASMGAGVRGSTGAFSTLAGKPTSSTITLDNDGAGNGWYFDPVVGSATVPDDGEFTSIDTPFQATFTGAGAAADDNDLYRTIAHELGHAMGILIGGASFSITGFLADTGIDDPFDTGTATLQNLNTGGGVIATLTENGGGHLFEGPGQGGGTLGHPDDLLNAGRTVSPPPTTRQLISDLDATILQSAYGYTIAMPSTINTFYANLNTTTNVVTVTGDANTNGSDADIIDLEVAGTAMSFEVNGTDENIEGAQFTSIVVNAGLAADDVDVDQLLSGKTVTLNMGDGSDRVDVAIEDGDIDNVVASDFTVNGGIGTDSIFFHDELDGPSADTWDIGVSVATKNVVDCTYSAVETLDIDGGPNATTYNITGLSSGTSLNILAQGAADTFNVGVAGGTAESVNGDMTLAGGAGADSLNYLDSTNGFSDDYTITDTTLTRTANGTVTFNTMESVQVECGTGNNDVQIVSFLPTTSLVVNGNDGNDIFTQGPTAHDMNTNWTGNLTINGGVGTDSVSLDDSGDATATEYTINAGTFGITGGLTTNLFGYTGMEDFHWLTNNQSSTINITGTATACNYLLEGANGNDVFRLGVVGGNAEGMNSPVTIAGNVGDDSWIYHDLTNAFSDTYSLTSTTVNRTANTAVTFNTVEHGTVFAGTGNNTINVPTFDSIATELQTLFINAGSGNDAINLGSGDLENDLAFVNVTVVGDAGTDDLTLNDSTDAEGDDSYTITSLSFDKSTAGLALINYGTMESMLLNANGFSNVVNIDSTIAGTPVTVNGNGGKDTFEVGGGDWDSNLFADVSVNGGADPDRVHIDDLTDTLADNYAVNSPFTAKNSTATVINYSSTESYTLDANNAVNTITVNSAFDGSRVNGNGGADVVDVVGNGFGTYLTVDGGAALDTVRVNSDGAGWGGVQFGNSQDLAALEIYVDGNVRVNNLGVDNSIETNAFGIARGTLDLTDNFMVLHTATATSFYVDKLARGYNGGGWNGVPAGGAAGVILSTTAASSALGDGVGYAQIGVGSGQLNTVAYRGISTFAGDKVISYSLYGDANLDHTVDINDLAALATNWQAPATNWVQGNFNYDNITDINDLAALATNWQGSVPAPAFDEALTQVFTREQKRSITRQLAGMKLGVAETTVSEQIGKAASVA